MIIRVELAIKICVVLCLIGFVSSCSSNRTADEKILSTFKTLITKDKYKRFEISTRPATRRIRMMPAQEQSGLQRPTYTVNQKRLLRNLELVLEETGFCRDGYLLLGRYAGKKTNRLRGECRDKATEDDYQKFENTIGQW